MNLQSTTQHFLDETIQAARIPGMACAISSANGQAAYWYSGHHSCSDSARPVSRETIFDLASLTKVLTTHQWVLRLVSSGRLDLDAPIGMYLPDVSDWLAPCPVWRLSNHTSGLAAHVEFFRESGPHVLSTGDFETEYLRVLSEIKRTSFSYHPGTEQRYSDLGYILLAHICERVDEPLGSALPKLYGHSTGSREIHWRASTSLETRPDTYQYAATERCPWRNTLIQGEVHDDNCWSMGGIAGHAGAFGTLEAVHTLATAWLAAFRQSKNPLCIDPKVISDAQSERYTFGDSTRVLGWDRTSKEGSSSGDRFTPLSPGHLGFTGTSIWLDVEADVAITLLTNRVCPSRHHDTIKRVRPRVHNHLRRLQDV